MIIREIIGDFIKTYSDANKYIKKVGTDILYSEAIDSKEWEYEETDQLIEEADNIDDMGIIEIDKA